MSQQLDRAGVRPQNSPGLQTYTGQVMEIHAAEVGSTGKNRPRKIVISDNPGVYKGKTFRCWEWRDTFDLLQPGAQVTVHYEVEPNPDPTRHGSNMISHVEVNDGTGGGQANGSSDVWGSTSTAPAAATPAPTPDWTAPPKDGPPAEWHHVKQEIASKDDYWEERNRKDELRSLEMEAAWALKAVLDMEGPDHDLTDEQLLQYAVRLIILKRRIASEMSR